VAEWQSGKPLYYINIVKLALHASKWDLNLLYTPDAHHIAYSQLLFVPLWLLLLKRDCVKWYLGSSVNYVKYFGPYYHVHLNVN
jgi:hypothetical protein